MTSTAEIELTPGNVKAAMREAGAKSADLWMVPVENIRVVPGLNIRPIDPQHVAALKRLITLNGYSKAEPLAGFVSKEEGADIVNVFDGHHRLQAVRELRDEGVPIDFLPVVVSPAGTSMVDVTVGMGASTSGKRLTPEAWALLCKRLIGYGVEEGEIAERLNLSKQYVSRLLVLAGASNAIKAMVAAKEVSASNAIAAIREHGAGAAAFLAARIQEAKAGGKTKATRKTMTPQRDLVADGLAWLNANKDDEGSLDAKVAALLAHLTGAPMADIAARLEAREAA